MFKCSFNIISNTNTTGFICLTATAADSLNFLTSESAESASLILLKLKALPCNCLAPAIVCLLFEVRTKRADC